jgi:branched-chain amino acid transport system permease protein
MTARVKTAAAVVVCAGLPALLSGNEYAMSLLIAALTIAGVAIAWSMLANLGGMVSFGHAAFFGVGSYVSALAALRLGLSSPVAILVGGVGAAVASMVMLPALRLRGPYFALAILAYAEILRILATELDGVTGGARGLVSIPHLPVLLGLDLGSRPGSYSVIAAIALLAMLLYDRIGASHPGLALRAMHDSEDATQVLGVPSTRLKAAMLLLSALLTGLVGAFNAHIIGFLDPDYAFSSSWTVLPVVCAIFGGYRTVLGPAIGAVLVYLADQVVLKDWLPQGHQMALGVVLVAMILVSPRGLVPLVLGKSPRRRGAPA